MKFWLTYILVAILGTAGVYFGTQPLWRTLGLPTSSPASAAVTVSGIRPPASTTAPKESPAFTRQAKPVVSSATPPAPTVASGSQPDGQTPAPAVATATAPAEAAPTPGNSPYPPPTPGCASWGLTITSASYYSLSGENRGKLPSGTIMDVEDGRNSSKGDMSQGRVERSNTMAGPYLIANTDLVRFNVPRGEVAIENITTLKQSYALNGALDQRLADLKQQATAANPFATAYGAAVQKYNDFGTHEKALVAKRDAATGADRMLLMDQLRAMIPESQRLLRAVNDSKEKYNKWKAANPAAATPDLASDPQTQELQKQIAALEPQVKEIVK